MIIAFSATALVAVALLFDLVGPVLLARLRALRAGLKRVETFGVADPGRERRAEQRARELLRSCVNDEEWSMYRELGFIRVWSSESPAGRGGGEIAYLIYPHLPVVSFVASTSLPLHEYCVVFPDEPGPSGTERLPNSDDVLAKWMALTGDERHFLATANEHASGRQIQVAKIRSDLWRLSRWEGAHLRQAADDGQQVPLIND